jgi:hypothetical protein
MQTIKTAISIQKSLFKQADEFARKMKLSRSRLFALALEDYIHRQQNRELLSRINSAYGDEPEAGDNNLRRKVRRTHRRMVEGEW